MSDNENYKFKKVMKKPGKTLLIQSFNNTEINESLFNNLEGLEKHFIKNDKNSAFLTFDTPDNALIALKSIKEKSLNFKLKFSYYKIFFTINGLVDTTDYSDIKKDMIEYVSSKTNSNVLYCKFYSKNNKYLGCGDLTIDTLDGMLQLLSKDSGLKEFEFKSYFGSFFKFNDKNEKKENKYEIF